MVSSAPAGAKAPTTDQFRVLASGFLHLFASQVVSRLLTFVLNLLIARHLSPEAYGLSSVQFHLLTTATLLLSREGFRRGCMRLGGRAADSRAVLRVAWLVLPWGALVTAAVCGGVLFSHRNARGSSSGQMSDGGEDEVEGFSQAVVLHGIALLLELMAEPLYILAAVRLDFRVRMVVDTLGLVAKSGITLLLVSRPSALPSALPHLPPALVFSIGQLALSAVTLMGYGAYGLLLLHQTESALSASAGRGLLVWDAAEKEAFRTSAAFGLQAAEKLALGEGSKLVLATVQSRYNQGVYGLVSNLGGLVVRVLFQPLEEAAFAAFSTWRSTSHGSSHAAAGQESSKGNVPPGTTPFPAAQHTQLAELASVLQAMTKAVCLLGLLAITLGPPYSYTALRLVYGTKWSESEAPRVLAAYCPYILLLALNGITEAFVHAVLDAKGLAQSNALLLAASAAHLALCVHTVPDYGALGLVWADAANMLLRIAYSMWPLGGSFSAHSLLPGKATLAAAVMAAAASHASHAAFMAPVQALGAAASTKLFVRKAIPHVAVGGVSCGLLLVAVYVFEGGTLKAMLCARKGRAVSVPMPDGAKEDRHTQKKKQ